MSKVISFFLASSITDIAEDRIAVGDFINQINNIYQPNDVFIKLYKCEDESMDHSVIIGGTQKTLNELIRESDLCFVIFWHKAGEITEQELKIAYESFTENNQPKIVVYFKRIEDGADIPADVRRVMRMIDEEMLHYHREYSHIDSLKLGIVMQLQLHGFIHSDLKVEQNAVTISGQPIASTSELPLFSQNEEYRDLIARFKLADEECARLLQQYGEDRNNARAYREYMKKVKERDRLKEDVAEMADGILNIGRRIAEIASGTTVTERIQKAIKCFDVGDYQGVLDILTPEEIEQRAIQLDVAEEQIVLARRGIVEEYRLRILALEAQGKWSEVYETYRKAIAQVEDRREMPQSIMLEFARFLYRQKQYQQGIAICEKLRSNGTQLDLGEYATADLLDLLGALYYTCNRFDEAETVLKEALDQRRSLSKGGYEHDVKIADTCVSLAKVYFIVNRHFESEALYLQALALYRKHDTDAVRSIDASIAKACIELGDLYYMINRHADAAKLFLDACGKYRELVEYGEKSYSPALAQACNKVAYLYIAIARHKVADRYYVEALAFKQRLTQAGSTAYFAFLQQICEKLGRLWRENGSAENAEQILREAERIRTGILHNDYGDLEREELRALDEEFYRKPIDRDLVERLCGESLRLYTELAQNNPEAYEASLAQSYDTFGVFYTYTRNKRLAEYHFAEAIKLREILAQRDPSSMRTQLAGSYSNLSHHYELWEQLDKAETYSLKAIEIYASVSQKNAGAFDTDLARNYHELANLYTKAGDQERAERFYLESILLYVKLFEKSPRAYVDRIINTIADITMLLDPIGSSQWMREFTDPANCK